MITLFKNQKPIKMEKSKVLFMEQRELEIKEGDSIEQINKRTEDFLNQLANDFKGILKSVDSICKERKAKNG